MTLFIFRRKATVTFPRVGHSVKLRRNDKTGDPENQASQRNDPNDKLSKVILSCLHNGNSHSSTLEICVAFASFPLSL